MTITFEDVPAHGLPPTYAVAGCRCVICTEAWAVYCRSKIAERKARLDADPTLATHGKASTYQNWGCRCRPCTEAASTARAKSREKREAQNLWENRLSITT